MARTKKAEAAAAKALRDELEEIEAVPLVTAESVERFLTKPAAEKPVPAAVGTALLAVRGDEEPRQVTVSIFPDDNGRDSILTIEGAGIGIHFGYVRVSPGDQLHSITFDGDTFEQTLRFVATHAIVVIDDSDEIRVGTAPTDRKDPDNG